MEKTAHRWIVATLAFGLVACGGGSSEIRVEGAWARAMPLVSGEEGAATNSAVYLLIRNDGGAGDRLEGVASEVAERAEIHESKIVNDMMAMEELEFLEIRSGGSVELNPGGIHIMLLGIKRPLLEGESFELILRFEKAGDITIAVPVRLNSGN